MRHVLLVEVRKTEFSLPVPDNDWFVNQITIEWNEAATVPLCLLTEPMRERQIVEETFRLYGIEANVMLESNSIFQLAFHVMKSNMATIIPNYFIKANKAFTGTRVLELVGPEIYLDIGMFWSRNDPIRPMTKAMIAFVQDFLSESKLEDVMLSNTPSTL